MRAILGAIARTKRNAQQYKNGVEHFLYCCEQYLTFLRPIQGFVQFVPKVNVDIGHRHFPPKDLGEGGGDLHSQPGTWGVWMAFIEDAANVGWTYQAHTSISLDGVTQPLNRVVPVVQVLASQLALSFSTRGWRG